MDQPKRSVWSRLKLAHWVALAGVLVISRPAQATSAPIKANPSIATDVSFEEWLRAETQISFDKMIANISPNGTARGIVIASPQKYDPDYFFHWVRDAALVMDVIGREYVNATDAKAKDLFFRLMHQYVEFSRANQLSHALTGLGEPKFNVDGSPYMGPWGRPQNDGPALRALTLTRLAQKLLAEGQTNYVRKHLYESALPATTVIKADLEYVAHRWQDKSFDLWEEWMADHFYTRLVQYAALNQGASLARTMGDFGAANFYATQARNVMATLHQFWDANAGYIRVALHPVASSPMMPATAVSMLTRGGIDSAVILGILHVGFESGDFSVFDSRVMSTVERMEQAFASLYPINDPNRFPGVGPAIGRYPEDVYSGTAGLQQGNPWVLSTAALAEFYYELATKVRSLSSFTVDQNNARFVKNVLGRRGGMKLAPGTVLSSRKELRHFADALSEKGDSFMKRVRLHQLPDGSLSEQIDRHTGYMRSAADLTWSYASVITASRARR